MLPSILSLLLFMAVFFFTGVSLLKILGVAKTKLVFYSLNIVLMLFVAISNVLIFGYFHILRSNNLLDVEHEIATSSGTVALLVYMGLCAFVLYKDKELLINKNKREKELNS